MHKAIQVLEDETVQRDLRAGSEQLAQRARWALKAIKVPKVPLAQLDRRANAVTKALPARRVRSATRVLPV